MLTLASAGVTVVFANGEFIISMTDCSLLVNVLVTVNDVNPINLNLTSHDFCSVVDTPDSKIRPVQLRYANREHLSYCNTDNRVIVAGARKVLTSLQRWDLYTYMRICPTDKSHINRILQAIHKFMY